MRRAIRMLALQIAHAACSAPRVEPGALAETLCRLLGPDARPLAEALADDLVALRGPDGSLPPPQDMAWLVANAWGDLSHPLAQLGQFGPDGPADRLRAVVEGDGSGLGGPLLAFRAEVLTGEADLGRWIEALPRLVMEQPRHPLLMALRRAGPVQHPPLWLEPPAMQPARGSPPVPEIRTPGDLAVWLGIDTPSLDWFADIGGRCDRDGPLCHYRRWWVPKPSGGRRLVEAPKARLKILQRCILDGILSWVPVHDHAFGFVPGRSAVQAAGRHAGEPMVVCLDLRDFFPSIGRARVRAVFRGLGYPEAVSRLLTGLTTTCGRMPGAPDWLSAPHLPQGAPTSPALANLVARRLDRRLAGLARALGAGYSRYADDMAFSGPEALGGPAFRALVARIVAEEGFRLAPDKTRVQPASGRQTVTGIVVNRHLNLSRPEFDRLKAILTNCARTGPEGENREGHPDFRRHLEGRVLWVERLNPGRGAKLRAILDAIRW